MADTRKKGCPNIECVINKEEKKLKNDMDFCPKCGTKLIYVCSNKDCYNELTSEKFKDTICNECKTKSENKKAERKEKRKEIADKSKEFVKEHGKDIVETAFTVGTAVVNAKGKGAASVGKAVGKSIVNKVVKK